MGIGRTEVQADTKLFLVILPSRRRLMCFLEFHHHHYRSSLINHVFYGDGLSRSGSNQRMGLLLVLSGLLLKAYQCCYLT
jgi:hypothetical protein